MKRLLLCGLACLHAQNAAPADDRKTSREQEQIRRLKLMVQQSQEEAQSAREQLGKLETEAKSNRSELDGLQGRANEATRKLSASRKEIAGLTEGKARLETEAAELRQRLEAAERKLAETGTALSGSEARRQALDKDLAREQAGRTSCEQKNLALYRYGQEMLTRYQSKGVWTALVETEPVTGIGGVEIENVLQEYREKLDAARVSQSAPK